MTDHSETDQLDLGNEWEDLLDKAWELAEDEGRSFDVVMGELLGGIR